MLTGLQKIHNIFRKFQNALYGGGTSSAEKVILFILNTYLCFYTGAAVADIICIFLGWGVLGGLFSFGTLLFSFAVFLLCISSAAVPKRFFLAPILYIPIAVAISLPVFVLLGTELTDGLLSGFQLFIGVLMLVLIKKRCGRWLLDKKDLNTKPFSFAYLLRFFGGTLLTIMILTLLMFSSLILSVHLSTSGFVRITPVSIKLAEKTYKKENKRIILVGMSHVASKEFYKRLKEKSFGKRPIILSEGVSDHKNLINKKSHYNGIASLLGKAVQSTKISDTIPQRNADLDVSVFSTKTINILNIVFEFNSSLDNTLNKKIGRSQKITLLLKAFQKLSNKSSQVPEENLKIFREDLIVKRNKHLLEEILLALVEYDTVIVPWGALHMPGVEQMIEEKDFVCKETNYSLLF